MNPFKKDDDVYTIHGKGKVYLVHGDEVYVEGAKGQRLYYYGAVSYEPIKIVHERPMTVGWWIIRHRDMYQSYSVRWIEAGRMYTTPHKADDGMPVKYAVVDFIKHISFNKEIESE